MGKEARKRLFREPPVAARRCGACAEITPEYAAERPGPVGAHGLPFRQRGRALHDAHGASPFAGEQEWYREQFRKRMARLYCADRGGLFYAEREADFTWF